MRTSHRASTVRGSELAASRSSVESGSTRGRRKSAAKSEFGADAKGFGRQAARETLKQMVEDAAPEQTTTGSIFRRDTVRKVELSDLMTSAFPSRAPPKLMADLSATHAHFSQPDRPFQVRSPFFACVELPAGLAPQPVPAALRCGFRCVEVPVTPDKSALAQGWLFAGGDGLENISFPILSAGKLCELL